MWFDGDPNWGFGMDVSEDAVRNWTSDCVHSDFREGWLGVPNSAKAEQFLVNTVQGGKPVMVLMEVDDSFGAGSGGHFATVVGVKTDSGGKLQSVLVATNWNSHPIYEIPANSFMDDWMNRNGGEYMTVGRAPAASEAASSPN